MILNQQNYINSAICINEYLNTCNYKMYNEQLHMEHKSKTEGDDGPKVAHLTLGQYSY